jgi:hypothetical protein
MVFVRTHLECANQAAHVQRGSDFSDTGSKTLHFGSAERDADALTWTRSICATALENTTFFSFRRT